MLFLMFFFVVNLLILLSLFLAPFPYWPAYFMVWRCILFDREPAINWQARRKQIAYLIKRTIQLIIVSIFWILDDLIVPQYRNLNIKRPIFIVGQPRSGTTFLHRTLAADETNFFSIRLIEWCYPSILLQKLMEITGILERLENVSYWGKSESATSADEMHQINFGDYEEDGMFFEECFFYHNFIASRFPYPSMFSYMDSFDSLPSGVQQKMIECHRKVIQKILYLRGKNCVYLSKEVQLSKALPMMAKAYPDALFILMTRQSDRFVNSWLVMAATSSNCKLGIDVNNITNWEDIQVNQRLESARTIINFCENIPKEQKLLLSFDRFVENISGSINLIYDKHRLSTNPQINNYLEQLNEKQRTRKRSYKTNNKSFPEMRFYDEFVDQNDKVHREQLHKQIPK
jgi:omega-hydroxy-beta-dihydromenaquinone-9 sulfotransferase